MNDADERLVTIYQMIKSYYTACRKGNLTHSQRNYRMQYLLETMDEWRLQDKGNEPISLGNGSHKSA